LKTATLVVAFCVCLKSHAETAASVDPSYKCGEFPAVLEKASMGTIQPGQFAVVEVGLDAEGRVVDASIASSSSSPAFDRAFLDAVKGWTFLPAVHNGRFVPSRLAYRFMREEDGAFSLKWISPSGAYVMPVTQRACGASRRDG